MKSSCCSRCDWQESWSEGQSCHHHGFYHHPREQKRGKTGSDVMTLATIYHHDVLWLRFYCNKCIEVWFPDTLWFILCFIQAVTRSDGTWWQLEWKESRRQFYQQVWQCVILITNQLFIHQKLCLFTGLCEDLMLFCFGSLRENLSSCDKLNGTSSLGC